MQVEAQVLAEHGLLEGMSGPGEAVVQFHALLQVSHHDILTWHVRLTSCVIQSSWSVQSVFSCRQSHLKTRRLKRFWNSCVCASYPPHPKRDSTPEYFKMNVWSGTPQILVQPHPHRPAVSLASTLKKHPTPQPILQVTASTTTRCAQ